MSKDKSIVSFDGVLVGSFEWFNQQMDKMTDLPQCEAYIENSARAFVLAGQAFRKIRDNRFYERDWKGKNFESYCQERWGLGRWQVNNIIRASSAALLALKKMGDRSPKFSATVWGLLARFVHKEEELVESAADLLARYGEGCTVSEAREHLKSEDQLNQAELDEKLKNFRKAPKKLTEEEETKRSLLEYEELHALEKHWENMTKDHLFQEVDENKLAAFKKDLAATWNKLLKTHGHSFPGLMLIEIALKFLVQKYDDLEAKMKHWSKPQ